MILPEIITAFLFLLNLICLIFLFFLWKRVNVFFRVGNNKNKNFESLVKQLLNDFNQGKKQLDSLEQRLQNLEILSKKNLVKLGLVRFNAFKELGGNQSFALAILDLNNNGIIISSFYTREGNRTYAKSVSKGKSEFPLSEEENRALQIAINRVSDSKND